MSIWLTRAAATRQMIAIMFAAAMTVHAAAAETERVVFSPQWTPQAQFAGYYMAKELGLYRQDGMDIVFLHGGPDLSSATALQKGEAQLATLFLSSGIKHRAAGLAVVNIAQISRRSSLMFVARKSTGIHYPADLAGRRVGMWQVDFQEIPRAFLRRHAPTAEPILYAGGVNIFLQGGVDAVTAMWYNEYHTILNSGIDESELTTFFMADTGFNIPEDGIYCLDSFRTAHPGLCAAFIRASVEGWRAAFQDESRTLTLLERIMKEAHQPFSPPHQRWMLRRMKDAVFPGGDLAAADWTLGKDIFEQAASILKEDGAVSTIPAYQEFHRPLPPKSQRSGAGN